MYFLIIFFIFLINNNLFSFDNKSFKSDFELINNYRKSGDYLKSAELSIKWATIFENENMLKEASILYGSSAKDYELKYRIDDAIKFYKKGINLIIKDPKFNNDKQLEKTRYNWIMNIGILSLYYKYNIKEATEYLETAYKYFDKQNNLIEKGIITRCFGVKYRLEGNKSKAFEMFDLSMGILKDISKKEYFNTFGEKLEAYLMEDDTKKSLIALEKYQTEIFEANEPKVTIKYFLTLSKLTNDLENKKKYLSYCEQNLLKENIDINLKINVLLSIANYLLEERNINNYDLVISKYEEALKYAKTSNNQRATFNIQNLLGQVYYEKRDFEKCYFYLLDSIKNLKYEIPEETINTIYINIGISLYYLNKFNEAISYLEKSLDYIEKLRKSIVYSDEKSKKFFIEIETCYKHLILSYIKCGKNEKAFNIYELSKARNFLNNLSIRNAFYNGGVNQEEIEIFNKLVREINVLDIKISNVSSNIEELLEYQKIRKEKIEELSKFIIDIENRYPKFAEIRNPKILNFSNVKDLLKEDEAFVGFFVSVDNYIFILKKDIQRPIIISLAQEIDKFSNMLITSMYNSYKIDKNDYNDMVSIFLGKKIINKVVKIENTTDFVVAINEKGANIKKNPKNISPQEYLEIIKNLYGYFSSELFKREVMTHLTNIKKIYLCPDGSFWTMPIEALVFKDPVTNNYFIFGEKYNVCYIQSLSTIDYLNKKSNINTKESYQYDIITLAGAKYPYKREQNIVIKNHFNSEDLSNMVKDIPDSYLTKTDGRNQKDYYYKIGYQWKELEYANSDLKMSKDIFKESSKCYGGAMLSEERVKYLSDIGELSKSKILFFSLHGYMDPNNSSMSSIIFTLPENVSEQTLYENNIVDDGYLNASEISSLKLNNCMVVLSACETGTDKIEGGEGVAGICQSFFIAGAKNVIATLWSIDDRSSSDFMKIFFTRIKDGKSPIVALQEAKIEFRKNISDYLQPFYWAPFIFYGNFE